MRSLIATFTVSGTGSDVVEYDFFPNSRTTRVSGRIRRVVVKEDVGGGATATDIYFFTFDEKGVAVPSTADQSKVVVFVEDLVLTASASAVSLDSPITAEPAFQNSLVAVFDVTAVGAWTITGWVELEC
jgi:hypothetical protein